MRQPADYFDVQYAVYDSTNRPAGQCIEEVRVLRSDILVACTNKDRNGCYIVHMIDL